MENIFNFRTAFIPDYLFIISYKCSFAFVGWLGLFLMLCGCRSENLHLPEPGVTRELAQQRKEIIRNLSYELSFSIPGERNGQVDGEVAVLFELQRQEQVVLDFREGMESVKKIRVNGVKSPVCWVNEHIVLPRKLLQQGSNRVEVEFVAGNQSLNWNEDYLYTLLVPDRARTLFPCFDQPDLKANYILELDIPEDWVAVANGPLEKEQTRAGRKRLFFQKTQPLSTYLFSFVAGRWEKEVESRSGRTVTLYHRETDSTKLAQTGIIFDQVFAALDWMEKYTGIPYPFTKYDLVIVPGFQFGGMEHAGAVLYNDKRMFLSEYPTMQEELGRMELISHETAHMWFGDHVTMAWFDDVWTKEVFANYFASRMSEPLFLQINHRLNALRSFSPAAYSEDRTQGTNAIRQPLDNLNNAGLIYGQIVYNKAPIVMTMLVERMGEENFRKGIQEYLHIYAYGNATWDGLIEILDRYTPVDLTAWSRAWVDEKGMPEISAQYHDGQLLVESKDGWGRGVVWPQQVCYLLVRKPMDGRSCYDMEMVTVGVNDSVVAVETGPGVEYILPNADGQGYGYFRMDTATLEFCLGHIAAFKDPVTRLAVIIGLNENRLNGRILPEHFIEAILEALKTEAEPLIFTAAVGYVKDTYRRMPVGKNTHIEQALLELAARKGNTGNRQAAFRALLNVWTQPAITCEIYRLWNREKSYPGLVLSERDEMKMAYELSVRMPEQYREVIEKQGARIENPDRKREFYFVAQAVTPDSNVCDSLFRSLLIAENRRMEPWVSQMLYYLNHPLREQQSVKYIIPALENLPEIQRTGDIFFPKNWISACLQGHNSHAAACAVRQFLQQNPDFPPLLRNKILQSADHLFRRDAFGK